MVIRVLAISAVAFLLLLAGAASGVSRPDHGSEGEGLTFSSSVIGSTPGQTIGGIASGSAPWTVQSAHASLDADGKIHVELEGLVIVGQGTTGPVTQVLASLVCGGSGGTIVAETAPVSLDANGNAEIEAAITLPQTCAAPVILIRVAGLNGQPLPLPLTSQIPFIALTGFAPPAQAGHGHGKGHGHDH